MGRFVSACLLSSAALTLAACSPFGNAEDGFFHCTDSTQCISGAGGAAGTCVPTTGACAYPDSSCPPPDNLRYGTDSAQAGQCVGDGPTGGDAGSDIGPHADAAIPMQSDAPLEAGIDARQCWGTTLTVCPKPPPTSSHTIGPGTLDTDGTHSCDFIQPQTGSGTVFDGSGSAGPDLCVISAVNWTVYDLTVTGSRPLVIFAIDTIDLPYVFGAQKYSISTSAGQDNTDCATSTPAPQPGAGGAGGGFYTAGGGGGAGDGNGNNGAPSTSPTANVTINSIRGGCRGEDSSVAQTGGHSGGAVYLLAGNEIDIGDNIFAPGQGGVGGGSDNDKGGGGGGGGTGGFIGIEAGKKVKLTGPGPEIWAHGAGGGGGGGTTPPQKPGPGGAQAPTAGGTGAAGSTSGSKGGTGGNQGGGTGGAGAAGGSAGNGGANGTLHSGGGGGGGGGGDGVIWLTVPSTGGSLGNNASPPALTK